MTTLSSRRGLTSLGAVVALSLAVSLPASAQSLKDQLVGTWALTAGTEVAADGSKIKRWTEGRVMFDANGNIAHFLIGPDRPKTGNDPRVPVGPAVGYWGTYTVNEADKSTTWKIERAMWPGFDGIERKQTIAISGDTMTSTGSPVQTPQGPITPVNEWKRVK